jgi:hypothetical protein
MTANTTTSTVTSGTRFPAPRPGRWRAYDLGRDNAIRQDTLRMASHITIGAADAAAVLANTRILLGWLAAALTRTELEARHKALTQQYENTVTPRHLYRPDNGTGQLLAGADVLLAILLPHRAAIHQPTHQRGQALTTATP